VSEVGLVHPDDVDWFLTMDETHHEFTTVGAKVGASAGRYINPSFPRSGESGALRVTSTQREFMAPLFVASPCPRCTSSAPLRRKKKTTGLTLESVRVFPQ